MPKNTNGPTVKPPKKRVATKSKTWLEEMDPFVQYTPTDGVTDVSADILQTRHKFASIIARIIACYSRWEMTQALLAMNLTGGKNTFTFKVFSVLNEHSKKQVMDKVLKSNMSANLVRSYSEIEKKYSEMKKIRNQLAHGIFGIDRKNKSIIILVSPSEMMAKLDLPNPFYTWGESFQMVQVTLQQLQDHLKGIEDLNNKFWTLLITTRSEHEIK